MQIMQQMMERVMEKQKVQIMQQMMERVMEKQKKQIIKHLRRTNYKKKQIKKKQKKLKY